MTLGQIILINPGGPTEELADIAQASSRGVATLTLSAALQHRHEQGEIILALRSARSDKLDVCSEPAVHGLPPPVQSTDLRTAGVLFDDLSPEETIAVAQVFMSASGAASGPHTAKIGQSYITGMGGIELLVPTKEEALAYLDADGQRPSRYARVVCARPSHNDVMEYRVGPISGLRTAPKVELALKPLLEPGAVPFAKRPPDLVDTALLPLVAATMDELRPLLENTFGHAFPQFEDTFDPQGGIVFGFPIFPDLRSTTASRITMVKFFWISKASEVNAAMYLHPVPFIFRSNQTGADPSAWYAFDFYFCGRGPFESASKLQADYAAGKLPACRYQKPDTRRNNNPGDWDVAGWPAGTPNPRTTKRGPRLVYPDGPRWKVSAALGGQGRQVEWMGWSFFVSQRPATGLSVWDIRFKGRRIVYELSWQESAALYGGGQGDQTYYLDAAMTGLGQLTAKLREGVDCPVGSSMFRNTRAIAKFGSDGFQGSWAEPHGAESGCIFEADDSETLWSHANVQQDTTRGVRGSHLVVRTLANSGNYDYYANVLFGLDGSITWKSQLAGYAETRWFDPAVNDWERSFSPIAHGIALPLHAHLLNVKADLDIGAHKTNALDMIESVVGWPDEAKAAGATSAIQSKFLRSNYVLAEGAGVSTMMPNTSAPKVWRVVNRDAEGPSPYSSPGYAILPGEATVNTLPGGHPLSAFVSFAKYTVAFTRRHEAEQRSSSLYDCYAPGTPHTSLDRFLADAESLNQTDLVAWITIGHEHIPRTEDLPLISNYAAGFRLVPWNFFDGNPGMDLTEDATSKCLARAL